MNKFLISVGLMLPVFLAACGGGGGGSTSETPSSVTPPGTGVTTLTVNVLGAANQLVNPQHMTYDNGYLYLVDVTSGTSGTVRKINPSNGTFMSAIGTIESPVGVAFNAGTMYVTGRKPSAGMGVLQVATDGTVTEKVTGLNNPSGLVFDSSSYSYVAVDAVSKVLSYTSGFASAGYVTVSSQPVGLGYDGASHSVFVTRYSGGSQGVYWFSTTANPVTATAYATSGYFNQPNAMAVVRNTLQSLEIYVVNTGGHSNERSILKISNNGATVETYLSASNRDHKLCNPTGIATDGTYLYIANSTCSDGYSTTDNTNYAKSLLKVAI